MTGWREVIEGMARVAQLDRARRAFVGVLKRRRWGVQAANYARTAQDALASAEVLMGLRTIPGADFLAMQIRLGDTAEHDGDTCGMCARLLLGAQLAREMLAAWSDDMPEDVMHQWAIAEQRRWRKAKFCTLWNDEVAAGRDPEIAFKARGWTP